MRLIATETISPGVILAKTIRNSDGRILLNSGVVLSERIIERLIEANVKYVYIVDERLTDVNIKEPIPEQLRSEVVTTIEKTFKKVKDDLDANQSLIIEDASKQLTNLVRKLMEEVQSDEELLTLLSDVYIYDDYIFTHSLNVTMYSLAIAQKINLPEREIETLGLGALLHDVGKMKIDTDILKKPSRLTVSEFEKMKKHTVYGFEILKEVQTIPLLVAHCAFQHHERLNGSGYPRGLKGNDIHKFAKIIAIADVFDAITTNRVYRDAMLPHEGLEILYAGTGTLFEPEYIDAFRKSVAIYPVGMMVKLNDDRSGVVTKQNPGFSDRPVLRILEESGVEIEPYEVDLKKKLDVVITGCNLVMQQ